METTRQNKIVSFIFIYTDYNFSTEFSTFLIDQTMKQRIFN